MGLRLLVRDQQSLRHVVSRPACGSRQFAEVKRPDAVCDAGQVPRVVPPVLRPGSLSTRPQPILGDHELTLRPWAATDAAAVAAAYSDPDIEYWHARTMTLSEAEKWVAAANQSWLEESAASWALTRADDELAGRSTIGAMDLAAGQADVRYWVVPSARGRRFATRSVNLITAWAMTDLGLHRLELEHSTQNPRSCRVATQAGYQVEGTRRSQALHRDGWHDMHLHARINCT